MDNVLFSIITICYNSSATIDRTIKSVLGQTYKDFEYIIVDGGSTDGTIEILKRYDTISDGKMKWKSEPDKGIYDAMNKGIRRSSGQIVGIVNSDDWLEPDALINVKKSFIECDEDNNTLYCGGIHYVMSSGVKEWKVDLKSFYRQVSLYIMSGVRHPGLFVPLDVYKRIGLFNSNILLSADQDFVLRCFYGGVRFYDIKQVVSNMAEGGISTNGSKKSWLISVEDRKIMLKGFNITGLKYTWLMQSWYVRNFIKSILVCLRLYR